MGKIRKNYANFSFRNDTLPSWTQKKSLRKQCFFVCQHGNCLHLSYFDPINSTENEKQQGTIITPERKG